MTWPAKRSRPGSPGQASGRRAVSVARRAGRRGRAPGRHRRPSRRPRRARALGRGSPIAASSATHSPFGAERSRSRIRPRSQRLVDGEGRCRLADDAASPDGGRADRGSPDAEPAPRPCRARLAPRRPRPAERRPDVHQGMRPLGRAGPRGTDASATPWTSARRATSGIAGDDATEDAADVDVDRADRRPEGDRRHGASRVRPDPGQCLELRHGRRDPPAVLVDDDPRGSPQGQRASVVAKALPRAQDVRRASRQPAPRRSGTAP